MGSHTNEPGAQRVLDHLRRIVQSLRTPQRSARGPRLSGAQLLVLQQLREHGPATMGQLADRTLTHQSSVSVVVSRLATRGLVRRQVSPEDRRSVRVSLTPKGERLTHRSLPLPHAQLREAILALPPRDQLKLASLLGQVVDQMGLSTEPPPMFFEEKR